MQEKAVSDMAENTKIQWATHTFNPWRGCQKIAPGCANCYADAQSKRNPGTLGVWGPNGTRVVASEAMWREPLKWDREAKRKREAWSEDRAERESLTFPGKPERPRVFCASLADVFEDWGGVVRDSKGRPLHRAEAWGQRGEWVGVDDMFVGQPLVPLDDVRARLFRTWKATQELWWLALTKRPENIRRMLDGRHENLWLGTSIACQEDADRNVPELLKCRDLSAKTFLSIEPLIGPVDFRLVPGFNKCGQAGQDIVRNLWVIVGGESGPNARPCDITWIRSIVRQCRDASVPVFVKQWGANPHYTNHQGDSHSCGPIRDPKGGDMAEWPEDIRVREVPS